MAQTLHAKAIISAEDRVSGPLAAVGRKFDRMHKSWSQSVGALGDSMARAGRTLTMGVTVPAALMVREAANWQTEMANWAKAADQLADPKVWEQSKEMIKDLSRQIPLTQVELTQLAKQGSLAGIAFNDLRGFVEMSAKAADAFEIPAEEAGDALAGIKVGAGLTNEQLNILIGQMDMLENSMKVRGRDLIYLTNNLGAVGRQAGFTNEAMIAMGGTIVAQGFEVGRAEQSLRRFYNTLTAGESMTKGQKELMGRLGLEPTKFAKAMQKNADAALDLFITRFNKRIPEHERGAMMTEFVSQYGQSAILALLDKYDTVYSKARGIILDHEAAAKQLDASFAKTIDTLNNRLKISRNHLVNVADTLATRWMPTIDKALRKADDWLSGLEQQPEALQRVADGIGAVAVAGPALWITGTMLRGIGDAFKYIGKGATGLGRIGFLKAGAWTALAYGAYRAGKAIYEAWPETLASKWERVSTAGSKLADSIARLADAHIPDGKGFEKIGEWFDAGAVQGMAAALDSLATSLEKLNAAMKDGKWGDFLKYELTGKEGLSWKGVLRDQLSGLPQPRPAAGQPSWFDTMSAWFTGLPPAGVQAPSVGGPSVPSVSPLSFGNWDMGRSAPMLRDLDKQEVDITGKVSLGEPVKVEVGKGHVQIDIRATPGTQIMGFGSTWGGNIDGDVGTSMQDVGTRP